MKKSLKIKLVLNSQTVRRLRESQLSDAQGGYAPVLTNNCRVCA